MSIQLLPGPDNDRRTVPATWVTMEARLRAAQVHDQLAVIATQLDKVDLADEALPLPVREALTRTRAALEEGLSSVRAARRLLDGIPVGPPLPPSA